MSRQAFTSSFFNLSIRYVITWSANNTIGHKKAYEIGEKKSKQIGEKGYKTNYSLKLNTEERRKTGQNEKLVGENKKRPRI